MIVIVLFPYLSPRELARFCQLNKSCCQLLLKYVNFQNLFEAQGVYLSPGELEDTRISTSKALQAALKYKTLKAIIKSKRIIPDDRVEEVTGNVNFPNMATLVNKSWEELTNLTIKQMQWYGYIATLGFTLNDGQSVQAGSI